MRVLLDTNVLIAAFVARGVCADLLEYCVIQHRLVTSRSILDEFEEKLVSKFGASRAEARQAQDLLAEQMELVKTGPLDEPVCRDPDDDVVLATAWAGQCGCLVTGDKDLPEIKIFHGIPILSPRGFWGWEAMK